MVLHLQYLSNISPKGRYLLKIERFLRFTRIFLNLFEFGLIVDVLRYLLD